ncbi:hypothetical protein [uncultured Desulfobacter sp.]|uniref:hypothetical protein n=1 Tax=uncultured Desulfobacter sp. TaxID=240139 RepID=UPI0029F59BE3|nr:hypothetical protein [uncultured Desulfobacter sp.]
MKKLVMVLIATTFMYASAFAGENPEFDVVGCDADWYFSNSITDDVVENVLDSADNKINEFSDFTYAPYDGNFKEYFTQTAGQEQESVCFPGYMTYLIDAGNSAEYKWRIVLQQKPDTDLDISIRDCVQKMNSFSPYATTAYEGASQTGRYKWPWGTSVWTASANPTITAKALPGEYKTIGFPAAGFYLDARTLPELTVVPLVDKLYTSKALWEESIVVAMPETGVLNGMGETQYRLKQGDMIEIEIKVPGSNTVNMSYGAESVALKYVGIYGMFYQGASCVADAQL